MKHGISKQDLGALRKKFRLYLKLSKKHQDESGFIMTDKCDSLIFSALYGTVLGVKIDITAAQKGEQWFRRPINLPECLACKESKSTISRDQLLGLMIYINAKQRIDLALRLYEYGKKNNWIMGQGTLAATIMTPYMRGLLAEIIFKMNGEKLFERKFLRLPKFKSMTLGYEAHLDVLGILLEAELTGEKPKESGLFRRIFRAVFKKLPESLKFYTDLDRLKFYYESNKENALFVLAYRKFVDQDYSEAASSLLNESLFPVSRLPTSSDRSEPYLWQRDKKDWAGDGNNTEYPGSDFLCVTNLIFKEIDANP